MKLDFWGLFLLLFLGFKLDAQNIINTDRPDQSDGTHIVEKNHFQIETGVQFSKIDEATKGFDNVTLIRFGVIRTFEIRFLNQYSVVTDSNSNAGIKPPTLSLKNELCKQSGLLPKITLVSYFHLPVTINSKFPGTHLGYTFTLAGRHDLNKELKIYSNLGISKDQQLRTISYLTTLEINYNVTQVFSSFIEYFGNYAPHSNASNGVDFGFIYALRNNFALDISAGSPTLNLSATKFISMGMSLRLPANRPHQKNNS